LKKPQLETQLALLEEQLAQYKKLDDEYRTRGVTDKAKLEKELTEKLEKEKADALLAVTEKAAADAKQLQKESLLVLSQFLRLAAARRTEEADQALDENMALEGVLLNVYSGDEGAVATMIKLIEGSEEKTKNVQGDELQTSCESTFQAGLLQKPQTDIAAQLPKSRPLQRPTADFSRQLSPRRRLPRHLRTLRNLRLLLSLTLRLPMQVLPSWTPLPP
jgi:hypothetical protein